MNLAMWLVLYKDNIKEWKNDLKKLKEILEMN